ncbi:MAG: TonB-dependent receptor [Bacteroidales bacterium]|nr:TonB-dependent receptor [Bacteroidales bacterium]
MNSTQQQGIIKGSPLRKSVLMMASAMGLLTLPAAPVLAQQGVMALEEIIVTARRREERLQDVPVSMTVLNQQQMDNANIFNAGDLATYTPSLQANTRFGSDNTNFAIRGFSQELRTTSSVGVYFAEVVAPRGANTTQSGDGAGPGDLFDLENVQVLKGPQGTLFGRNTTGGAVLLSPKKPTDEFEGYIEGSMGNYDMGRVQGVVNIPVSDSFRMRFGVDHMKRDGYLKNISDIGPRDFADTDYVSLRGSFVWDITDTLENYTIIKYSDSENNGAPYSVFACNTSEAAPGVPGSTAYGAFCQGDLNRRIASGNNGEYDVYNFLPNPKNEQETIQVINTTTWEVSDNLTIKNIMSYAEFESRSFYGLYGNDWRLSDLSPFFTDQHILFQMVGSSSNIATTDQKTFVEELQFQGTALNDRLTWQMGLYYEKSKPNGTYGSINPSTISCDYATMNTGDIADWRCNNIVGVLFAGQIPPNGAGQIPGIPIPGAGSGLLAPGGVEYENKAVYVQGTYEFNDQWSVTAGLRYTDDDTKGWTDESVYYFPGNIFGGYFEPQVVSTETRRPKASSEEPTWLIGLEYKPTTDMMLYGKYARGYRQGSVNLGSVAGWDVHGPEQVDTYEIGLKSAFGGRFPATFNMAVFYNDFEDQQVQFGYLRSNGVGTTSIINAGASTIWGVEMDGTIMLTDNLSINASYAYLDTEVDKMTMPQEPYPDGVFIFSGTSTREGDPLSYSPKNSLVVSANYLLPLDDSLGDITASVTYVYTDDMEAVSPNASPLGTLPSYELVNFNLNWARVAGSPVDVSLFVTNAFDEKYRTNLTGNYYSGLEMGRPGVPRMYGARLRYNF